MNQYWSNLTERERWYAIIGVTFSIVYLFYLIVFSPLQKAVTHRSTLLHEKKEMLAWMSSQQPLKGKALQPISTSQLLTLIASQLKQGSLQPFVFQLQQTGQEDVQLSFDSVPYQQVLLWFWSLNEQYALTTKQFVVERTEKPGLTKVTIIIEGS